MIQSLMASLAHHKFLSVSENPDQMEHKICSVQFMDLLKQFQVVNQLKYVASVPFPMTFKCSQLMFQQMG
jgi:hypothetical protein